MIRVKHRGNTVVFLPEQSDTQIEKLYARLSHYSRELMESREPEGSRLPEITARIRRIVHADMLLSELDRAVAIRRERGLL